MSRTAGILRVPPPTERVPFWHVSPAIDMAAYHFSWLWVLLPLAIAGPAFPNDYIPLYIAVLAFGFVHRHYTLGYVYLDREIFQRHRRRFVLAPVIVGAGLLATPYLLQASVPASAWSVGDFNWPNADFRLKVFLTTIVFGAGLWNIWHTMAQKYGILRIYAAKARSEGEPSVPGWVDRLFIMGWLPLILAYLVPRFAELVVYEFRVARSFVQPIVNWLTAVQPVAVPLAIVIASASLATFVRFEWQTHRFRNRPRLSMAIGTASLWACFFVLDPVKVYLSFAFSHGLEYMVFVWAYQRRRYAEVRIPQPLMARILEHPWIAYPLYTLALGAIYVLFHNWQGFEIWKVPHQQFAFMKIGSWIFYWGVFQSLLRFYFDGFLWKARKPEFRQSL